MPDPSPTPGLDPDFLQAAGYTRGFIQTMLVDYRLPFAAVMAGMHGVTVQTFGNVCGRDAAIAMLRNTIEQLEATAPADAPALAAAHAAGSC